MDKYEYMTSEISVILAVDEYGNQSVLKWFGKKPVDMKSVVVEKIMLIIGNNKVPDVEKCGMYKVTFHYRNETVMKSVVKLIAVVKRMGDHWIAIVDGVRKCQKILEEPIAGKVV